jgi:Fe-S-cluster containining protein
MRTEFGFERTICGCDECVNNCRRISGSLIPNDLERLLPSGTEEALAWAMGNLMASPGAIVIVGGEKHRIPTLVPARLSNGVCKFLVGNRCSIHENAPYGCAFFGHMPDSESNKRSWKGLQSIFTDSENARVYQALWMILHREGKIAAPPETIRNEWYTMTVETPSPGAMLP